MLVAQCQAPQVALAAQARLLVVVAVHPPDLVLVVQLLAMELEAQLVPVLAAAQVVQLCPQPMVLVAVLVVALQELLHLGVLAVVEALAVDQAVLGVGQAVLVADQAILGVDQAVLGVGQAPVEVG
jgi:hypothetical protein